MEPTKTTEAEAPVIVSPVATPKRKLSVQAAILIAGLMVCASIFAVHFIPGAASSNTAAAGGAAATPSVNIKDVVTAGEPFIGDANAPATMAYFSDYQCPYCKQFDTTVLPTIIKTDVDTGKLKIVFKDFTFLGPDSTTAALFAHSIWKLYPSQYFAWREAMYAAQDGEDTGFGNRATIEALIRTIPGLDQAKISADVDANTDAYQKAITADYTEGQTLGVTGTPSIIVGTTLISGFYPLANYTDAISKVVK